MFPQVGVSFKDTQTTGRCDLCCEEETPLFKCISNTTENPTVRKTAEMAMHHFLCKECLDRESMQEERVVCPFCQRIFTHIDDQKQNHCASYKKKAALVRATANWPLAEREKLLEIYPELIPEFFVKDLKIAVRDGDVEKIASLSRERPILLINNSWEISNSINEIIARNDIKTLRIVLGAIHEILSEENIESCVMQAVTSNHVECLQEVLTHCEVSIIIRLKALQFCLGFGNLSCSLELLKNVPTITTVSCVAAVASLTFRSLWRYTRSS